MLETLRKLLRSTITSKTAITGTITSSLVAVLIGMLGADSKVNPDLAFVVVAILIVLSGWFARQAAHSNPDGTHASKPYRPQEKGDSNSR